MGSKLAAAAGVLAAMLMAAAPAIGHGRSLDLQFRGQAIVPSGTTFAGTTVGGLSSITYDAKRDVYYAISDDQGQFQPARFYTLGLDVRDGRLADGDVRFTGVTTLLAPDGQPYPPLSLDPEGLVLTKDRRLIYTSEGLPASLIDPFVRRAALDGSFLGSFDRAAAVPRHRRPVERRPAEPRVRERGRDARRAVPVHRDRERAVPGRARRRRSPAGARRGSSATACVPAGSTASSPTSPIPSPSRPCRRPRSRSTASSSSCRSTTTR